MGLTSRDSSLPATSSIHVGMALKAGAINQRVKVGIVLGQDLPTDEHRQRIRLHAYLYTPCRRTQPRLFASSLGNITPEVPVDMIRCQDGSIIYLFSTEDPPESRHPTKRAMSTDHVP